MPKKVYPPADPEHLCHCECHDPDSSVMHCEPCCYTCVCGANVDYHFADRHRETCVPKKNRHKKG